MIVGQHRSVSAYKNARTEPAFNLRTLILARDLLLELAEEVIVAERKLIRLNL
jgi:hypothetical protein